MLRKTAYSIAKGIKNPQRAAQVITERMLCSIGQTRYRRFIILSRARTGSNLLLSFLNSHPNVRAEGEIFEKLQGKSYQHRLNACFTRQPYFVKAKGFKIFYYHPQDDHSCGIWEELVRKDDLCVIHLKRNNILKTLLSLKIAKMTDQWTEKGGGSRSRSSERAAAASFTREELAAGFEQTRDWESKGDEMFRSHPLISVQYDDLAENPVETFRSVSEFLGVPVIAPKTSLKKQSKGGLREAISNYDELKTHFANTQWSSFFED